MNYNDYFHVNYASSGTKSYVKVSIEIIGKGMFCVIMNSDTGAVQCQKYPGTIIDSRIYCGVRKDGFMNSLGDVKAKWSLIAPLKQTMLLECVNMLAKSYRKFLKETVLVPMTITEQEDVYRHIREIRTFILDLNDGKNPEVPVQAIDGMRKQVTIETENWVPVRLNSLSSGDLTKIIEMVNEEGNPDFGITYNGRKYKIVKDGQSGMTLKTAETDTTETTVPVYGDGNSEVKEPRKPVCQRKTTKKALMRDNENMTEFVNGCYYRIVKEMDSQFVKILTDEGQERTVRRNRLAIVEVYDEPPQAE